MGLFLQTSISGIIGLGIYFVTSLIFKLPESMAMAKKFLFRSKGDRLEEVQPPDLMR